jgi:hypothetical protein
MRNLVAVRCVLLSLIPAMAATFQAGAQMNWFPRYPGVTPPLRAEHTLAYDAARKRIVFFGGSGLTGLYNGDTWEWDGNTWVQRLPPVSPLPRCWHAMAYDSVRQRVVVSGGFTQTGIRDDFWEWDGNTWWQQAASPRPPVVHRHAMAYDAARRRLVVFGGWGTYNLLYLNETWESDGNVWTKFQPAVSPEVRVDHAMAYDAARRRVVLFGGMGIKVELNDTWEWDGSAWTRCTPSVSPPVRYQHAMAYDSARGRIVLFGGFGNYWSPMSSLLDDTWEWDGREWTRCAPRAFPQARAGHAMAYDAARQCVVLVGGGGVLGGLDDTWEWSGPFLVASGLSRPGSTVEFSLNSGQDAGLAYVVGSSFGTGPIKLGDGRRINLGPDNLLAVSVANQLPGVFAGYCGVLDGQGQARASIHIPNIPPLVGARIHTAFVTLDSGAPAGIRSISSTEMFTIGK